jgi:hypothetical protein
MIDSDMPLSIMKRCEKDHPLPPSSSQILENVTNFKLFGEAWIFTYGSDTLRTYQETLRDEVRLRFIRLI